MYLLESIRYTSRVTLVEDLPGPDALLGRDALPSVGEMQGSTWAVDETGDSPARQAFCQANGMEYAVLRSEQLAGFPLPALPGSTAGPGRKKVLVTGCYDWLHSGHVRFFEEVSQLGELYVAVGNDANVRLLKGEGHPMLRQDERRYMVQAIRFVYQALITSGFGWMDAE
jgi:cytidyltransferase-like protein